MEIKKSRRLIPGHNYAIIKVEYDTKQEQKGGGKAGKAKGRKSYHVVRHQDVLADTALRILRTGKTVDGRPASIDWEKMEQRGLKIPLPADPNRLHQHSGLKAHPVTEKHKQEDINQESLQNLSDYWVLYHDKNPDMVNHRLHAHAPFHIVHPVTDKHSGEQSQSEHRDEQEKFARKVYGGGNKSWLEDPGVHMTLEKHKFKGAPVDVQKYTKGKFEAFLFEAYGNTFVYTQQDGMKIFSGKRPAVEAMNYIGSKMSSEEIKKSADELKSNIISKIENMQSKDPDARINPNIVLNKFKTGNNEVVLAGSNGEYSVAVNGNPVINTDDFTKAIRKYYSLISNTIDAQAKDKDMALEIFGEKVLQVNRAVRPMIEKLGDTKAAMFLFDFEYDLLDFPFKAEIPRTLAIGMVPVQEEMGQGEDDKGNKPNKEQETTTPQKERCQDPIETPNDRSINPAVVMKTDLLGSPLPASPEESQQDKNVPINTPQKAQKEDYARKNPENVTIDGDNMVGKSQDTNGSGYAEGINAHQQYIDLNTGYNKLGDFDKPIYGGNNEKVKKAAFSPDAPNEQGEPIEGNKQQDKIKV